MYDRIPSELRSRKRWLCWRYEPVADKPKPTKVPYVATQIGELRKGSSTGEWAWRPFDQAVIASQMPMRFDGIGLALGDGVFGIDLDGHIVDGEISKYALSLLKAFGTYAEISPSGKGIHILGLGEKPDFAGSRVNIPPPHNGEIEIYDSGQFLTMTGNPIVKDGIECLFRPCSAALGSLCRSLWKVEKTASGKPHSPNPNLPQDDAQLVALAIRSKNGDIFNKLFHDGDYSDYLGTDDKPDHSRGDLALCDKLAFWTDRDAGQMDRLFRTSAMYRQEKWDRSMKSGTYGSCTIAEAIAHTPEGYKPKRQKSQGNGKQKLLDDARTDHIEKLIIRCFANRIKPDKARTAAMLENSKVCDPPIAETIIDQLIDRHKPQIESITSKELSEMEFPEPKWAVPGLMPEGLTMFCGKSSIGKSWLALGLGIAVSCGGYALGEIECEQGDVLYACLEDNYRRIQSRQMKVTQADPVFPDTLHFLDLDGVPTMEYGMLEQLGDWLDRHPDTRMVIIDPFVKIRPATDGRRNAYVEEYGIVGALQRFALERNIALVIVHHTRKSTATDALDEINGSTAIAGAADTNWILKRTAHGVVLYVNGREVIERELVVNFDETDCTWTLIGDAAQHAMSEARKQIVELLESSGPLKAKTIASELAKPYSTVSITLKRMLADGLVVREKLYYELVGNAKEDTADAGFF